MKNILRACAWSCVWALAAGFWLLGPRIVSTHHLTVETPLQALPVIGMLCLLFAFMGVILGLVAYVIAQAAQRIARRRLQGDEWDIALSTGLLLVPAYVLVGCLIYLKRFGSDGAIAWCLDAARVAAPGSASIALLLIVLHVSTSRSLRAKRILLALLLAFGGFSSGAIALMLQLPEVMGPAHQAQALARAPLSSARKSPLLVVGIDGGTWRPIEPLMESGRLPVLASLIDRGSHGDIKALWPPYWSTTAWGAIITGLSREEAGVYGNLVVDAPGLPAFQAPLDLDPRMVLVSAIEYVLANRQVVKAAPPGRSSLKRPPIWEMLDKSGVKTAVVRFNFSHPAQNQASIVISNRVVPDVWDMLGVASADSAGLAWPDSLRDSLMKTFTTQWNPPDSTIDRIFPQGEWPRPSDSHFDPVRLLKGVLEFDQRTIEAVVNILQTHDDIEVLILHLGGLDNVQHVFWQYRFSEDFRKQPAAMDVAALAPVIDRYLEFLDSGIGRMVDAFPVEPNVMVISDHGIDSFEGKPPFKGWHASPGIFAAAGPGIPRQSDRLDVSYYDIVPTILSLKGLVVPASLSGRSLVMPAGELAQR